MHCYCVFFIYCLLYICFSLFRRYIFNWVHLGTGTIAQVLAGKHHLCCYIVDLKQKKMNIR